VVFLPNFAAIFLLIATDGDVGSFPYLARLGVRSGTKLTSSWWGPTTDSFRRLVSKALNQKLDAPRKIHTLNIRMEVDGR